MIMEWLPPLVTAAPRPFDRHPARVWSGCEKQVARPWSCYLFSARIYSWLFSYGLRRAKMAAERAAVSPFTMSLQQELGRARTWLMAEAQCCASLACALSVFSFPALSSTVTLPSPICLMNRRNYTITTTTAITRLLLTGHIGDEHIHTHTQVHQWFLLDSYGQTQVDHKEEGITAKGITYPKL